MGRLQGCEHASRKPAQGEGGGGVQDSGLWLEIPRYQTLKPQVSAT